MVRTRSGCWTCRLQTKKKCDEAKPECKRCTGLGIRCFGYGPRPRDDELGDDRRALIAPVGATSRTEDSAFRGWRLKPTLRTAGSATRPAAHPRQRERQSSTGQPPGKIPGGGDGSSNLPKESLVALDRINSGMLDFLHPQLLNNYTDHVFWLDSRFYQSPGPYTGNSWLKEYLVRSKETHLAAALMGLTWQMLRSDMSQLININLTQPLVILHSAVVQSVKDEIQKSRSLLSNEEVPTVGANLAHCAGLLLSFEVRPALRWFCKPSQWAHLPAIDCRNRSGMAGRRRRLDPPPSRHGRHTALDWVQSTHHAGCCCEDEGRPAAWDRGEVRLYEGCTSPG